MKDLVQFLVEKIVDNPESVEVREDADDNQTVRLTIQVEPSDIGKVIGKQGKTIRAIRELVKVKAIKEQKYVDVQIAE